jgi:hypothetical protein
MQARIKHCKCHTVPNTDINHGFIRDHEKLPQCDVKDVILSLSLLKEAVDNCLPTEKLYEIGSINILPVVKNDRRQYG